MRWKWLPKLMKLLLVILYGLSGTNSLDSLIGLIPQSAASIPDSGFPCQFHQCGCETAEHCQTACCCFPDYASTATNSCCEESPPPVQGIGTLIYTATPCRGETPVVAHAPANPTGFHFSPRIDPLSAPDFSRTAYRPVSDPWKNVDSEPPDKIPILPTLPV